MEKYIRVKFFILTSITGIKLYQNLYKYRKIILTHWYVYVKLMIVVRTTKNERRTLWQNMKSKQNNY